LVCKDFHFSDFEFFFEKAFFPNYLTKPFLLLQKKVKSVYSKM